MRNKIAIGLGSKIKEFRTAKELTMDEFAELTNLSQRQLSRIENGQSYPKVYSLERILLALNSKPIDLYNFEFTPEELPDKNHIAEICKTNSSTDISEIWDDYDFDILEYIENEIRKRTFIHKELNFTTSYNMVYRANKKNLFAINFFSNGTSQLIDPEGNIEKMKLHKAILEKLRKQRNNKQVLEFINQALDFSMAQDRNHPHSRGDSGKYA